jgi:hypothetical protein
MILEKLDIHMERQKLDSCLLTCTEGKSKWVKDLIVKLETLELLEENTGYFKVETLVTIFLIELQ